MTSPGTTGVNKQFSYNLACLHFTCLVKCCLLKGAIPVKCVMFCFSFCFLKRDIFSCLFDTAADKLYIHFHLSINKLFSILGRISSHTGQRFTHFSKNHI